MLRHAFLSLLFLLALASQATAATCTWQSGTASWTAINTASWTCGHVPTSSDAVVFDGTSGGGTVTVNTGGTITIQSLTMGAFTGTFDNSVNNNNITLTNNTGNVFNISGSGARTIKLGTATYTLSGTSAVFSAGTTTNLTYTGNTNSNIVFSGTGTGTRQFNSGSISHGNVTFGASSSGGGFSVSLTSATVNSLAISGPNQLQIVGGLAITNAFSWVGSSSNPIGIGSASPATAVSFTNAASSTAQWVVFYNCQFTNSPIATNSLDLGGNSGITITPPQAIGAGGGTLIGG